MSPSLQPLAVRASAALVVVLAGYALGGPSLAGQSLLWFAGCLVNFRVMSGLAANTATQPAIALAWGLKLPVTLALVAFFLSYSSPLAMVLGLFAAVNALLGSLLLAGASAPPRAEEA